MMNTNITRAEEIANELNAMDTWNEELLAELCELAGLTEEWENADGETFEAVAYKAAGILGVEI